MKEKIIKILRDARGKIISGPEISDLLGVSRVAVWKHLKQLKEMGYAIVSTPKGYSLNGKSDLPLPFYFTKRKNLIHHYPTITSTMNRARELARDSAPHMTVVIAEEQQSGRGRLNRKWFSQKGGLWFTLILRPDLPPPLAWQVNFTASVSLSQTIRMMCGVDVSVKWPNDILFKERKLAGFLSEMETQGDMISFVNIGIGLNANNTPRQLEPNSISISDILGKPVHRRDLLSTFLDHFEDRLNSNIYNSGNHQQTIIDQWKEMTSTIGKQVTIETCGEICHGKAIDVDESGALVIQQEDGSQKKIIYGDCFHQKGE